MTMSKAEKQQMRSLRDIADCSQRRANTAEAKTARYYAAILDIQRQSRNVLIAHKGGVDKWLKVIETCAITIGAYVTAEDELP